MKRIISLAFILSAVFLLFSMRVTAENEEGIYKIERRDREYVLTCSGENASEELAVGGIGEILTMLNQSYNNKKILFDRVQISHDLVVSSDLVISGEILASDNACIIIEGNSTVRLEDLQVSFTNSSGGGIVVKEATLNMYNTTVTNSKGAALTLSGSDRSALFMESSELISSEGEALKILCGEAKIKGCRIRSLTSEAINNAGRLYLLGNTVIGSVGYDVCTRRPIHLSDTESVYEPRDTLSVCFISDITKGELTRIFLGVNERMLENVEVFSQNGVRQSLKYFDEHPRCDDKSFAAIYLPFYVSVYDSESLVYREERLKGELFSGDFHKEKFGYEYVGVYKRDALTDMFDMQQPIEGDIDLTIRYKPISPEFELSGLEFVYDGEERVLKATDISHPLGLDSGTLIYEWYFNGEVISENQYLNVKNVAESGEYTCAVRLKLDGETSEPFCRTVSVKVAKARIEPPILSAAIYNSKPIYPTCEKNDNYKILEEGFVNAGKYTLTARLQDPSNYTWTTTTEPETTLEFEVLAAEIFVDIEEYDLYLFSEIKDVEYKITEGIVYEGDSLNVKYRVDGNKIVLESANPNYVLKGNVARINRIIMFDPRLTSSVFVVFTATVFVILVCALLFIRRRRLFSLLKKVFGKKYKKVKISERIAEKEPFSTEPDEKSGGIENENDIISGGIDAEHADELITDSLAKDLLKRSREIIYTHGRGKEIVNVDTLSKNFHSGDRVDVNTLKAKGLISADTAYIKIMSGGEIDKSLSVYANDFSLSAIKMIALMAGEAIKVVTVKESNKEKNDKNY